MNKIQFLLNWCQYQTEGYPNVSIKNFTTAWRNGLAFNAIIHKFKPELINFHDLDSDNIYYNNYIAYKTAELHFGIPTLLDPKDMSNMECPERLSVITYVSQFYNCLKEMKPEGGYHINKFESTNNDNSEFEIISSRASVHRLTKVKCSICNEKVYLLERYVADDKLYHRKCYRKIQIKSIDNESEIIGDYLNIYGELKSTMNKDIFVHPIQGLLSKNDAVEIKTTVPVNILDESSSENEEFESEIDESGDLSESLSSYEYSESEDILGSDSHIFTDEINDNEIQNENQEKCIKESSDEVKSKEYNKSEPNNSQDKNISVQEILTFDNKQNNDIVVQEERQIKDELADTEEFELNSFSDNDREYNNQIDLVTENMDSNKNIILDKTVGYTEIKDCVDSISTFKNDSKNMDKCNDDAEDEINYKNELIIRKPSCQENLVVTILDDKPLKPLKQRLYIKKRDKELPYSTFFEIHNDECNKIEFEEPSKNLHDELINTLPENISKSQKSVKRNVSINKSKLPEKEVKKLIEIIPDEDYESDVLSIEDEQYECIKPQISRNSIWRKPIISSVLTKKHKSARVPIEGKFRDYAEFKDRLKELNAKQSNIESKARKIQQTLWEENSNSEFFEELLAKWLELVEEKDKIFYEENALYSWIKDLKLQEMKLKLEAQIRLLSASGYDDQLKKEKEKELVAKLIETVNQRSELVDAMHEENLKRLDILKLRHEALESVAHNKDAEVNFKEQKKADHSAKYAKKFWKRKASDF